MNKIIQRVGVAGILTAAVAVGTTLPAQAAPPAPAQVATSHAATAPSHGLVDGLLGDINLVNIFIGNYMENN